MVLLKGLVEVLAIAALYVLTGRLGFLLAIPPGNVTAVWLPSGIALAALLLRGYRVWPGVWFGSFLVNTWFFAQSTPAWGTATATAAHIAVGSTLQALLGAFLIQRMIGSAQPLGRAQGVLMFVAIEVVSCALAPTIGVTSLSLAGFASWATYPYTWWTWWIGDLVGVLVIAPFVLSWCQPSRMVWTPRLLTEGLFLLGLLLTVGQLVFWAQPFRAGTAAYPIAFTLIPFIVWAALRFGPQGVTTAMLVMSGLTVWGTINHLGPFARVSLNESLLLLQSFIGIVAVTGLFLAAAIEERRAAEAALQGAHDELERRVEQRTAAWAASNEALREQVIERQKAEQALQTAYAELDQRVHERTSELAKTNALLRSALEERKLAEEELRQARDQLEERVAERTATLARANEALKQTADELSFVNNLAEQTTQPLVVADFHGRLVRFNRAFEQLTGYSAQELSAMTYHQLMPERWHPLESEQTAHLLATGQAVRYEKEYQRKDGMLVPIELVVDLFRNAQGKPEYRYAFVTDITERKQAEYRLQRANELLVKQQGELLQALVDLKKAHEELQATQLQLIQAAKFESVGRLAAGVAHEVKNPLATLLIGLDDLSDHFPTDDEQIAKLLEDMQQAVRRADAVIKGLLDFSSPERLELVPTDLNAVIEQSLLLVKHELDRYQVTVAQALDPTLPLVRLDRRKMEQVFVNLFVNAIEAMPQGGRLAIRTLVRSLRSVDLPPGRRPDDAFQVGAPVVVTEFDDTGIGVPEEHLSKVFDPFFTLKPAIAGTGLGLTVSRKIVELHGGVITLRNRPEGGVRVTLLFNAARRMSYGHNTRPID